MIKRIFSSLIILIILAGCGYQPIYSSKNFNFSINKLEINGDLNLNRKIRDRLSNFQSTKSDQSIIYDIKINTTSNRTISTKDAKGNPALYALAVTINLNYSTLVETEKNKSFSESINYQNNDNKFDLKRYENTLKINLTNTIIEDIILFLQNEADKNK